MGKINTDNYPNRPFASYQDDDMFILQDNGGETYTTNVGDIKNLADSRIKLEGVQVNGTDLPISGKKVNVDISGKTDLKVIAFPFHDPEPGEPSMGFFKGAYVTYNGKLYEFTQEHQGAWNPSHVREINAAGWYVRVGNGGYNSGDYATTEGHSTRAEGEAAHAEGTGTIANSDNQHAGGRYNVADPDDTYARIIGNGTGDNARSNALTLDWNGNLAVSGEVEDGNGEKISDKADKVADATSGHLAGLDSNGNLTDSGVSPTEDVTVEGNPVTFDSPFEQDAKSVVVSVKPIQDLHGYDHPWPAGGGKNKCPYDNVSFTSANTWCNLEGGAASSLLQGSQVALKAGTYYISMPTNTNIDGMQVADSNENVLVNSKNGSFTLATDETIYIRVKQEVASQPTTCKIQIETGSSATTFAPYSNICPISGTDEVEIDVSADGNIVAWSDFHAPTGTTKTVDENTATLTCDGSSAYQSIDDGGSTYQGFTPGTYRVKFNVESVNDTSFCYLSLRASNHSIKDGVQITGTGKYSSLLTISENCYLSWILNGGTAISNTLVVSDLSVEKVATTTIPLPSTLYGGEVDVTNGVGTKTWKDKFKLTKTMNWAAQGGDNNIFYADAHDVAKLSDYESAIKCDKLRVINRHNFLPGILNAITAYRDQNESYPNQNWIYVHIDGVTTLAELYDWLDANEPEITYELATPTTISFTPVDVELLEGTNVVTTNGEKVAVKYGRSLWQDISDLKTDTEGKLNKSDVATIEGDTASKAYSVNDFMLRADGFYKVTQPIAQNASITSSNTTKTTVGEVLTALLNA